MSFVCLTRVHPIARMLCAAHLLIIIRVLPMRVRAC